MAFSIDNATIPCYNCFKIIQDLEETNIMKVNFHFSDTPNTACFIKFLILFFTGAVITSLTGCNDVKYEKEYEYESPSGEKTVTVKVDYVSRPDVFYNDECIFEYNRPGFTGTEYWKVEWISENEIRLYLDAYKEEDYSINIPNE